MKTSEYNSSAINALREIYILAEMYNTAMRSLFLFLLLLSGVTQIISVVALMQPEPLPFLVTLFFTTAVLQTIIVILGVYGFAGEVHKMSTFSMSQLKLTLRNRYTGCCKREHKYFERFLFSCQAIKIRFGLSNFIEKSTPPVFQLFCLARIIDWILVL